eukprot:3394343-Prymnesium_polylepis.1
MAMSIAPKAGDPSTLFFGVGLNDCEGWLMQLRTRDVLSMLFARQQRTLPVRNKHTTTWGSSQVR